MLRSTPASIFLLVFTAILFAANPVYSQSGSSDIDSLKESIDLSVEDSTTVRAIYRLADKLGDLNQNREAIEWTERGIELAERIGDDRGLQMMLIKKADHYFNLTQFSESLSLLDRAEQIDHDENTRFDILNTRANIRHRTQDFYGALEIYGEMELIAQSTGDLFQLATVKNNMANLYGQIGDHDQSLEFFMEALDLVEEMGREPQIAIALNNIGNQLRIIDNFEQAKNYLYRSKTLSEEINLQSNLVRTFINLGNTYRSSGDTDQAAYYHRQALEIHQDQSNPRGLAQAYFNLGNVELDRENYDMAYSYFSQGLEISEEIGLAMGIYFNINGIGRFHRAMGQLDSSIESFTRALDIARQLNIDDSRLTIYEELYETYKLAGNTPEALNWLEQYNSLSDSLQSDEKERLTTQYEIELGMRESRQKNELLQAERAQQEAQLTTQKWIIVSSLSGLILLLVIAGLLIYNSKKRAKANKILETKNRELQTLNDTISKQKDELQEANQVKTKLFGIVAHDLRTPINSIQSLLYLIRDHALSKKDFEELSKDIDHTINENATLMDNLLAWAKSQMEGLDVQKQQFQVATCVRSITEIFATQSREKGIEIITNVPEELSVKADYDMIKLVIRNLVANAIKFSHSDSKITIAAEALGNQLRLSVADEGVGIAPEHRHKIFDSINFTVNGTNNEQGTGLGLNLCKEFIKSHGGEIWFESELGKGTTFTFEIPGVEEKTARKPQEKKKQKA